MPAVHLPVETLAAIAGFLPHKDIRLEVNSNFTAILLNQAARQHDKITYQLSFLKRKFAVDFRAHLTQLIGPEGGNSPITMMLKQNEEDRLDSETAVEAVDSVWNAIREREEGLVEITLNPSLSLFAQNNAAEDQNTGRRVCVLASRFDQALENPRIGIKVGIGIEDEEVWNVFPLAEVEKELAELCRHLD